MTHATQWIPHCPNSQHARRRCTQNQRLVTLESVATWILNSSKCWMNTQGIKGGHGGSKTEYLDSWRISPLLSLREPNRVKNKRAQKTGDQVRKKQPWKSQGPAVVDKQTNLNPKQKCRVYEGHSSPYAPKNYRQNYMHWCLYIFWGRMCYYHHIFRGPLGKPF